MSLPTPNFKSVKSAFHTWSTKKDRKQQLERLVSHQYNFYIAPLNYKYFYEDNWTIISTLSQSAYGIVYRVRDVKGVEYALKISLKQQHNHRIFNRIPNHCNIVRHLLTWSENEFYFLLTELCDHSLSHTHLNKVGTLIREELLKKWTMDILNGLNALHSVNCIHLDIKPDNLLIKNGTCKIGDFGLASILPSHNGDFDISEGNFYIHDGDNRYLAPELLNGHFTLAADIFSLGVTLLELATDLSLPDSGECWIALRQGQFPPPEVLESSDFSPHFFDLIRLMLNPDPEARPTVSQLLYEGRSPWIPSLSSFPIINPFSSIINAILVNSFWDRLMTFLWQTIARMPLIPLNVKRKCCTILLFDCPNMVAINICKVMCSAFWQKTDPSKFNKFTSTSSADISPKPAVLTPESEFSGPAMTDCNKQASLVSRGTKLRFMSSAGKRNFRKTLRFDDDDDEPPKFDLFDQNFADNGENIETNANSDIDCFKPIETSSSIFRSLLTDFDESIS